MKSIKKAHLIEIRALNNPPKTVKMALESICLLIGEPTTDWKSIRQIVLRDNFIQTIVNFSTEDITEDSRQKMRKEYLTDPNYNFDTVNHASKACGPLVKWSLAQVWYSVLRGSAPSSPCLAELC